MKWTVALFKKEYIVDAKTAYDAKKETARLFNEESSTKLPPAYLISICRIKRHIDNRCKVAWFTDAPSVVEVEKARQEELREEKVPA